MVKIKQEHKIITPAERAEMDRLEEESNRILDKLAITPGNRELVDRLNQIDVAYVRLSGEQTMDY